MKIDLGIEKQQVALQIIHELLEHKHRVLVVPGAEPLDVRALKSLFEDHLVAYAQTAMRARDEEYATVMPDPPALRAADANCPNCHAPLMITLSYRR